MQDFVACLTQEVGRPSPGSIDARPVDANTGLPHLDGKMRGGKVAQLMHEVCGAAAKEW